MAILAGCSEGTVIRSVPPGAALSVNGRPVGVTPTVFEVPHGEWSPPYTIRLEKDGYTPTEAELSTQVAKGRVFGLIFTAGVLGLFRGPSTFYDSYEFRLSEQSSDAEKTTTRVPRTVFVARGTLPPGTFDYIGEIRAGSSWYGSGDKALDLLATEALRMGADAVIDAENWWRPVPFSWAAPFAGGRAVRLKKRCRIVPGEVDGGYFPRDEYSKDEALAALPACDFGHAGAEPDKQTKPTVSKQAEPVSQQPCTTDQILTMKKTGLSDEQIKKACADVR